MTGWRADDVVGRRCRDSILEHVDAHGHKLCESDLCPLARSMRTGNPSDQPVLVYAQRADGRRMPVSTSVAPLRDEGGQVVGGIEVFRDERVRLTDMEFAQRVQRHILPGELPGTQEVAFEVGYYPHDLVGGDFYWVAEVSPALRQAQGVVSTSNQGTFAFLVADVRGHGVSAALYTMVLSSHLTTLSDLAAQPGRVMTALNQHLEELTVADSFASAVYGVLDGERWELCYSNAGHPPLLLLDAEACQVEELGSHGPFLGALGPQDYEESTVALPRRGVLVAYTDGAIEVENAEGEQFDVAGLAEYLRQHGTEPGFPERVYAHVSQFNAKVSLADDVLVLVAVFARP